MTCTFIAEVREEEIRVNSFRLVHKLYSVEPAAVVCPLEVTNEPLVTVCKLLATDLNADRTEKVIDLDVGLAEVNAVVKESTLNHSRVID